MKIFRLEFVLGICFCVGAVSVRVRAAEASIALQQWFAAQTNLLTWSADLTQTRRLKTLTQPLIATGHVWFATPNKFRWEIGSPAQTIAVRSGDEMQVIYPRLKRVEKYPLTSDKMGQWKDTLGLLEAGFPRTESEMERQFRIVSLTASNDVSNLALEPRSAAARKMLPRITVSFSTNDFMLRATELQFGDGSVMRNDFRNGQTNPKIDEELFAPKIDPDFKLVEPMKR
jgi:outer membrane lipoprotein-sorting protein